MGEQTQFDASVGLVVGVWEGLLCTGIPGEVTAKDNWLEEKCQITKGISNYPLYSLFKYQALF